MNQRFLLPLALVLVVSGCSSDEAPAADLAIAAEPAATAMADQLYEMRTYTTHPGRLEALNSRFRDHTMAIFERNGMHNVAYWIPQDSARSENTLIYILSYPDREARRASWAAFVEDPAWIAARDASEADGPIVQSIESVFMSPTDYSPLR